MLRRVLITAALLTLAGCGDGDGASGTDTTAVATQSTPETRPSKEAVTRATQAISTGPVAVGKTAVSNKPGEPPINEIGYQGQVDLVAGKGLLNVDLGGLQEALGTTPKAMPTKVTVRWQGSDFWLGASGQYDKVALSEATQTGGILGRTPDLVKQDFGLIAKATEVTFVETFTEKGETLHRYSFKLPADSGQPQVQQGNLFLTNDGLLRRAEMSGEGRTLPSLPVRQNAMTLTFTDYGQEFTAAP